MEADQPWTSGSPRYLSLQLAFLTVDCPGQCVADWALFDMDETAPYDLLNGRETTL